MRQYSKMLSSYTMKHRHKYSNEKFWKMGTNVEFRFLVLDSLKYSGKVESPINGSAKAVISRNLTTSRYIHLFKFLFIYLLSIYLFIVCMYVQILNFITSWISKIITQKLFDVDVLTRKLSLIFKLGQLIGCLVKNIFTEKIYRKNALKTSAIHLFKACVNYFLTNFHFWPKDIRGVVRAR